VILRPKRYLSGSLRVNYGDNLSIDCEVVHPPSAAGRTVRLLLDNDDVTDLLLELRSAAIHARR